MFSVNISNVVFFKLQGAIFSLFETVFPENKSERYKTNPGNGKKGRQRGSFAKRGGWLEMNILKLQKWIGLLTALLQNYL